ncbi:hypothetical protein LINPERPRIM_LOCUS40600 [Linum perenne]
MKHQMMDERRNYEEWMIDPSLQQTVALLVEAFETVSLPLTKFEPRITHHPSPFFSSIKACP